MISMHELTNPIGIDSRRRDKKYRILYAPTYEPPVYTYACAYTHFSGRMPAADGY